MDTIFICFFSSRRRHTSSKRDWSSDVCSSDLQKYGGSSVADVDKIKNVARRVVESAGGNRSEERRVGKECRSRWAAEHLKKKAMRLAGEAGLDEADGRIVLRLPAVQRAEAEKG